jgi:hypothetical protein
MVSKLKCIIFFKTRNLKYELDSEKWTHLPTHTHTLLKLLVFHVQYCYVPQTFVERWPVTPKQMHSVDNKQFLLLFMELGYGNKHSVNDLRCTSVYRKKW